MYNGKVKNAEDKIPDIINLATNTTLNAKKNEGKGKIPRITNLATTTAVAAVGNEIPNVSNLVKKADNDPKIKDVKINFSAHLIKICLQIIYLIKR